jgi:hypothetical protein
VLAFDVEIDGEHFCVAGVDDWSLLTFHLNAMREAESEAVWVSMGGMTEDDENGVSYHLRWRDKQDLAVGSTVLIRVIETNSPDPLLRRYRSDREVQESPFTEHEMEEMERAQWLALKAKFEPDA